MKMSAFRASSGRHRLGPVRAPRRSRGSKQPAPESGAAAVGVSDTSPLLLLVDDNTQEREAVAELLGLRGYRTEVAASGQQALELLRQGCRPEMILLDLVMPEMNGWEFRIAQRSDAALSGIPVIVLSGETSPEAHAIDALCFLQKPVDADSLEAVVEEVLEHQRAERLAQTEWMASLGRLSASIAHEVNNPLACAKSNVAFLIEELAHPPEGASQKTAELISAAQDALEGLDRIERVVQDVMLFGTARPPLERVVDVHEPLRLALQMAAGKLRSVAVTRSFAATHQVRGDPSRLARAFVTFLLNAADALHEVPEPERRLEIHTTSTMRHVVVTFRDTGRGIDPALLPRIFEPFFSTKPVGEGAGLGLFVCRGLLESQGGSIRIESEPGKGTLVEVTLPAIGAET